jgi:hypothetical protein
MSNINQSIELLSEDEEQRNFNHDIRLAQVQKRTTKNARK